MEVSLYLWCGMVSFSLKGLFGLGTFLSFCTFGAIFHFDYPIFQIGILSSHIYFDYWSVFCIMLFFSFPLGDITCSGEREYGMPIEVALPSYLVNWFNLEELMYF